jgi:thiol:disulfide interchange protein DsbA
MDVSRRHFHLCLLGACTASLLPATLFAESAAGALREGHEWRAITPPQPGEEAGRIEVLEFFSYGCSHCARINPLIKQWASGLPEDVSFRRVPVTFGRAAWEHLARLYYALEFSGALDRLDQNVFDAVIKQKTDLYREKKILAWVEQQGIDPDQFAKMFNGFAVETRVARATALTRHYQVDGVPMIAVDGRYAVLTSGAKEYSDLFKIAERLIDKARQEKT